MFEDSIGKQNTPREVSSVVGFSPCTTKEAFKRFVWPSAKTYVGSSLVLYADMKQPEWNLPKRARNNHIGKAKGAI